jgi:hypothetical protein
VSEKWDLAATHRFFSHALTYGPSPTEVNTDRAPTYPRVLNELLPAACHLTEQYTNNSIEADHGRLNPTCGRCADSTAALSASNQCGTRLHPKPRRGHYELGADVNPRHWLPAAFARTCAHHLNTAPPQLSLPASGQRNTAPTASAARTCSEALAAHSPIAVKE